MATQVQRHPTSFHRVSFGWGALAGLIGGIAMAMVGMIASLAMGAGLWAMPSMIAGIVLGPQAAMAGGAGVVLIGFMLHMMLSVIYGLIYAAVVNGLTHEFWATGFIGGLLLWLVNFYVIGLVLPGAQAMAHQEPAWLAVVTHLVFGGVSAWVAQAAAFRAAAPVA